MNYPISEIADFGTQAIIFHGNDPDLRSEANQLQHVLRSEGIVPIIFARCNYRMLYIYKQGDKYSAFIVTQNYNTKNITTSLPVIKYIVNSIATVTSRRVILNLTNRRTGKKIQYSFVYRPRNH